PPIAHDVLPLSSEEVDYPALREAYQASMLASAAEVTAWRRATAPAPREPSGLVTALPAPPSESRPLGEAIQRRGSSRRFAHAPISAEQLAGALWAATRPVAADVPGGLVDLYVIVNAVDGVAPGAYAYWPGRGLELIRAGRGRTRRDLRHRARPSRERARRRVTIEHDSASDEEDVSAMKKYQLMAPGPTPVPSEVLLAMARPIIHHRTPEYEALFIEVRAALKKLFQTSAEVVPLACSGTGAMEAAVVNTLSAGDRVVIVRAGKFGDRWLDLANAYGLDVIDLSAPFGQTVDAGRLAEALK